MKIEHVENLKQKFHTIRKARRLMNVHGCAVQLHKELPINAEQDWLQDILCRQMTYSFINCHTLQNTIYHKCTMAQ